MQFPHLRPLIFAGMVTAALITGITFGTAIAREPSKRFALLISTSKTVMDEQIAYPSGTAKITTGIVTLDPGDETGWHTHGVPETGLILEGDLTVDYGDKGTRTFHAGESIAEAINAPHNGKNTGTTPMKLFISFAGAEGVPTMIPVKKAQ
jgi:quercetin dioxygenase-like cupin family protein